MRTILLVGLSLALASSAQAPKAQICITHAPWPISGSLDGHWWTSAGVYDREVYLAGFNDAVKLHATAGLMRDLDDFYGDPKHLDKPLGAAVPFMLTLDR